MPFINVPFTDNDINNFKKSNFLYSSDNFRDYQDPTVWGFKILFHGINSTAPGLLNENEDVPGTAAEYLKNIGDESRLQYLKGFTNMLQRINQESPWYFQSISGLGDAWKRDFTKPLKTGVITIGCLESVDFRLTTLIDLYRKACFDWVNRKEVVPKNLREFDMDIYVIEARRFRWWQNDFVGDFNERVGNLRDAAEGFKSDPLGNIKTTANAALLGSTDDDQEVDKINHILFKFRDCEFSLESGAKALDSATNASPGEVSQEISINYHHVEESNLNTLYGAGNGGVEISDYLVGSLNVAAFDYTPDGGVLPEIGDVVKNTLENLKERAIASVGSKALDKVQSTIQGALLGNVYGFTPTGIASAAQSLANDPTSALEGGLRGIAGPGPSIRNVDSETNPGNAFSDPGPSITNDDPETGLGNAFE